SHREQDGDLCSLGVSVYTLEYCSSLLLVFSYWYGLHRDLHSFPTRRSSDLSNPTRRKSAPSGASGSIPVAANPQSRSIGTKPPKDRKSTRLNSSHLGISYAVFCLKKKRNGGAVLRADIHESDSKPQLLVLFV